MKAFHFGLEKVLEWRAMLLRTAEEKLTQLQQELARLALQEQDLLADYHANAEQLMSSPDLGGAELQALAAFCERTKRLQTALQGRKAQCEALIADHRERLLKARKDHRILEKLREQRFRNWARLNDREIENTAAEVHLANWVRTEPQDRMGS